MGKGYVDTKKQVRASKRKGVRKSKTTRKKEGFDPPSPTLTQKKLEKILAVPSGIRVWMAEKAVFELFSFSDDLDQHCVSVTFDPETYSMIGETRSLF